MITNNIIGREDFPRAPYLTHDQHGQITRILDKDTSHEIMANMAGTTVNSIGIIEEIRWMVDSSATNHMASNLNILTSVKPVDSNHCIKMHLPNRGVKLVSHIGRSRITETRNRKGPTYYQLSKS